MNRFDLTLTPLLCKAFIHYTRQESLKVSESLEEIANIQQHFQATWPVLILIECFEAKTVKDFENIEKLCLSGTNELLFEMPMYRWSSSLRNTVLELNTRRDIRLVMAHADRYPVNDVREFIRAGIPLQLNVDSFLSFRKRAKSLEWIDNGCAVRIGSDIHGAKKLYAPWLKCKKYILKKLDGKI